MRAFRVSVLYTHKDNKRVTYLEKAERVSEEDREQIRPELIRIAELLMERYNMSVKEISRYLHGMIDVSI